MNARVPIIRASGEGDKQSFLGGGLHTWKLTTEDTDGAFFLFEDVMAQGKTTPLHRHPEADETVYVLEGEIVVNVDGNESRVGAGGMTFTPKGVPHAFRVSIRPGSSPADARDRPGVLPRRQRAGDRRHVRHGRHRTHPSVGERKPSRQSSSGPPPFETVS